ncbi:MAG: EVE domain-containing protein [Bauldia sp.]
MAYWLFKSEPDSWSWDQQVARGKTGQEWDGVRNFAARNHMRAMKVGDKGFFYHTGDEKRIVGIVSVIAAAHPETKDPAWECVDVAADKVLPQPVELARIRAEPKLAEMVLVRQARLSVQPVTEQEWQIVCRMGGLKT